MPRTRIIQSALIYASDTYDDNIAPTLAAFETNTINAEEDFNNLRSIASELRDVQAGNWYDALTAPTTLETGTARGVQNVNDALHLLEKKRILTCTWNLNDIAVPAAVFATGTLTNATNFLDTETVTIGSKVYTFQTALTNVDGNIQIGATVADSHANLAAAINLDVGAGTDYAAATTIHPTVSATDTATTTVVTAKVAGTAGNAIATTETASTGSWGAATLTGGAGDVVILGAGELPATTTAAVGVVTTLGTVVAPHGGSFGQHALSEVAGPTAISPINLMQIVDGDTRDPILSSGRQVYGLLQGESGVTDGVTITDTTTTRVQISFVRINATGDDLEAAPATDVGAASINYCAVERVRLEDLNEANFLGGANIDVPAGTTVTRQVGYDNQGTTPVDLTTNATLDLEGAGLAWVIRDDLEALLFRAFEGSAGGTSEIQLGSAVDVFNNDAIINDFASGLRANTGGQQINIGDTAGVIESTGANDLRVLGARELFLDDGNQTTSTWAQTDGIKLSDTTQEWNDFETEFGGEVSLLAAIVAASNSASRTRVQALVTVTRAADFNINGPILGGSASLDVNLPAYNLVNFVTDVDVFVDGVLLRNGANAAANEDVYPGTTPSQGDLAFEFPLKGTGKVDAVTVIVNGQ